MREWVEGEIACIQLTKGNVAIVDKSDLDIVGGVRWHSIVSKNTVYAGTSITVGGKKTLLRMHRVILGAKENEEVDHINGNGLDNRRSNLRIATRAQNQANSKRRSDNKSGLKGVSFHGASGRWQSRIRINGKQVSMGIFDSKHDAFDAYCKASKEHRGEYGRTE